MSNKCVLSIFCNGGDTFFDSWYMLFLSICFGFATCALICACKSEVVITVGQNLESRSKTRWPTGVNYQNTFSMAFKKSTRQFHDLNILKYAIWMDPSLKGPIIQNSKNWLICDFVFFSNFETYFQSGCFMVIFSYEHY